MQIHHCEHESHKTKNDSKVETLLSRMRERKIRITGPRREIVAVLARAKQPLSSEEIFGLLKKGSTDLVTVYRSLALLEESGVLRRSDFGDGVRRFEVSASSHHHHYVRCRSCGSLEAIGDCSFEQTIARILKKKGYQDVRHSLDVLAICNSCN
jgi:Fur family ferric uptake transcriptional regulator